MEQELFERPQCTIEGCFKLFNSKYNLKRHIESCHKGIRKYECPICFKRFSSKHNKVEHSKLEHSYSWTSEKDISSTVTVENYRISIPNLSFLVNNSKDPQLRPFSKVQRIYMTGKLKKDKKLPCICEKRQQIYDLPKFQSI